MAIGRTLWDSSPGGFERPPTSTGLHFAPEQCRPVRTSQSHPLVIAELRPGPNYGRIGLTLCPGKKQPLALSGGWDRDLVLDLDSVAHWGACAVVTLLERHELEALEVQTLGEHVKARHMDWLHLPVRDVAVPDAAFEREWGQAGEALRSRLRNGFNVLVHCKGGLGRAGTIAARLLVELGWNPEQAIMAVRAVRPGAIETVAQVRHVRGQRPISEPQSGRTRAAIEDRAIGSLVGLAVGDAVGTTLEFSARDSGPPLTDMVGGGPFRLAAGQWTDDTAMALALADSLLDKDPLDPADLIERFANWRDTGCYSCTGHCFDIGATVSMALARWKRTGDPIAGPTDPSTAGNGSLMRLAPVAIRYFHDPGALERAAALQSRTTHGAPEAIAACTGFAHILADAIRGQPLSEVLCARQGPYPPAIAAILAGSWRGKRRDQIKSTGYVAHTLEAAIWSVARTSDFRSAVLTAANLGEDADTTAAVAGQLAGAVYGLSAVPIGWLKALAWRERIEQAGHDLLRLAASS